MPIADTLPMATDDCVFQAIVDDRFSRSWTAFQPERGRSRRRAGDLDRGACWPIFRPAMPTNRITMRQIRQALRLHLEARLSYAQVARAVGIGKGTVGKFILFARAAGVDWAVAQTLTDEELDGLTCVTTLLPRDAKIAVRQRT
jgi:hypothetical protein